MLIPHPLPPIFVMNIKTKGLGGSAYMHMTQNSIDFRFLFAYNKH
jgi:hypothetical protein